MKLFKSFIFLICWFLCSCFMHKIKMHLYIFVMNVNLLVVEFIIILEIEVEVDDKFIYYSRHHTSVFWS